ncbi:MAG: sulfotransferase [Desulfobacterales bacterium]|nr:sulfotransferase [Desulfobacterales bacterium]
MAPTTLKQLLKKPVYRLTDYIVGSDYFRELFWQTFRDLHRPDSVARMDYLDNPYGDGPSAESPGTGQTGAPVFITARFRSGSTFLWQVFRQLEGVTAYYEPLNENQWFLDREYGTDDTHIGVDNYNVEYRGLSRLSDVYNPAWVNRNLFMTARDHDPALQTYITALIEATDHRPVLQFNRMDFRLAWLAAQFPEARIVHLYRHPRQQWMSILKDGGGPSTDYRYRHDDPLDLFYLINWAKDLRLHFPFLEPEGQHPYAIHYYLWRLSHMAGKQHAHVSIGYEELITDFTGVASRLFQALGLTVSSEEIDRLAGLNAGRVKESWRQYAKPDWFSEIEAGCDRVLRRFLEAGHP